MATAEEREERIRQELIELREFYDSQGNQSDMIRMWQEDFDFMLKRGKINKTKLGSTWVNIPGGMLFVTRGPRKRKKRKKRPPQALI